MSNAPSANTVTIPQAVALALDHHQNGRLAEAEALYRQILDVVRDHHQALHLLGVVALQTQRLEMAVDLLTRAVTLCPTAADYRLNLGVALRGLNRPAAAAAVYRGAIAIDPEQSTAYINAGNALASAGAATDAVNAYRRASTLNPNEINIWLNWGSALFGQGAFAAAAAVFRDATQRFPQQATLFANLGMVEQKLGRLGPARAALEQAVALDPAALTPLINLVSVLHATGCMALAESYCRAGLPHTPASADLYFALAGVLQGQGKARAAVAVYRQGLALAPDDCRGWSNLGVALQEEHRIDAVITAHRRSWRLAPADDKTGRGLVAALQQAGRLLQAEATGQAMLAWCPQSADGYETLASVRHSQRRAGTAIQLYRRALRLDPTLVAALNGCGNSLLSANQVPLARRYFELALALEPAHVNANNNLGGVCRNRGDQAQAVAYFRRSLYAGGPNAMIHSNLLLTLCYQEGVSRQRLLDEHLEWGALYAEAKTAAARPWTNSRDPDRRLKIAYVSPDLRDHAAAYFLEPLFENHDHERHHITAYAEVIAPDAVTARLRAHTDAWISTVGMSDAELAANIRAAQIDILIDLGGHTAHNRLTALADKPAPVMAHYLGYPATCGMTAFDYHIIDNWVAPEGWEDPWFIEKLWRLPRTLRCYKGPQHDTAVGPLPALTHDKRITFGSLNAFVKVGPEVIALWAQILRRVPSAQLLVVANIEPEALYARFAPHGVGPEQLRLTPRRPLDQFFSLFHEVDVALDPFPHAGGTTTFHSLWMGVPVITLAGNAIAERGGVGVLGPVGLSDFIAETPDDYVAIAERCAADIPALARLRAGLRAQMAASPLLDGAGFARDFEAGCREMWRRWCAQNGSAI